jgi:membrane-associated phospholipid phosphatase
MRSGPPAAQTEPLLGLPQPRALAINTALAAVFAAYFWIVYGACDILAAHVAWRYHVALPFESMIPFVLWAAGIYLTITPFLLMALFVLRTPERMLPLFATLCAEVTIAGVIFCIFPVELSFPPHEVAGAAGVVYGLARTVALAYNCVPSLHVALALTAAWAFAQVGGRRWRLLVWSWAAAIAASTLLIHQHHLVDLAAAGLLTAVCTRYVPPRVRHWLQARAHRAIAQPQGSGATRSA